jgi:elongation factor 1-alpha
MTDVNVASLFTDESKTNKKSVKTKNALVDIDDITNEYSLEPEIYYGNTEYKLLVKPNDNKRKNGLATQMSFRLREGNGHAIYWIGIMDNGYALGISNQVMEKSIKCLESIATSLGARARILSKTKIGNSIQNLGVNIENVFFKKILGITDSGDTIPDRYIASIEVVSHSSEIDYETITVGVMGNVNAGKSTLIGTLVTNENDNGKGRNRTYVTTHLHELTSGRTSSIGQIIMGYTDENTIKYYSPGVQWSDITKESNKVIKFLDLAGHEKYLKTTIKGLQMRPNYVIVAIEASRGVTDITKQHITLCRAHKIPFMILITKVDMTNRKVYSQTIKDLGSLLKTHFQLMPNMICDIDDAIRMADQHHLQVSKTQQTTTKGQVTTSNLVPVIDVSCVSGEGLDILKKLLYRLKPNREYHPLKQVEFYNENIYENVTGIGLVVSGVLTSGTVEKGQKLVLGPNLSGKYIPIKIKSIHVDKQLVDKVTAGHHCSFAIANVPGSKKDLKNYIRKDMVILDDMVTPMAYKTIVLTIKMLNIQKIMTSELKSISLGVGSGFVINFSNVRRPVTVKSIDKINTKKNNSIQRIDGRVFPGDTARITIELDTPAYAKKKDMCVLVESHMFGMGIIDDISS